MSRLTPRATARIRRWRADVVVPGEATGGRYAVVEHRVEPRCVTMPRHAYAREVTTYYALDGALTVVLDDRAVRLRPGESAVVPAGAFHALVVRDGDGAGRGGGEPARFLAVTAPAGVEGYFGEVAASFLPTGAPDMPAIHAASARHGVDVDMRSLFDLTERFGVELA